MAASPCIRPPARPPARPLGRRPPSVRSPVRPSAHSSVRPSARTSVRTSVRRPSARPIARSSVRPPVRPSVRPLVRPPARRVWARAHRNPYQIAFALQIQAGVANDGRGSQLVYQIGDVLEARLLAVKLEGLPALPQVHAKREGSS
jgi:hypothetical protein